MEAVLGHAYSVPKVPGRGLSSPNSAPDSLTPKKVNFPEPLDVDTGPDAEVVEEELVVGTVELETEVGVAVLEVELKAVEVGDIFPVEVGFQSQP